MSDPSDSDAEGVVEPFAAALIRTEAAAQQFVRGDSTAIKACWSHADDITMMGAGGGHPQGWDEVDRSLDGGASLFRPGPFEAHVEVDIIARGTSGDLSFTVAIERGEALMRGQDAPRPVLLRVTQIYRREADTWKIIHRHADSLAPRP